MKKLVLLFVLLLAPSVFAQQFLWSTKRMENVRHVSMNNVTSEVLEFYDFYRRYFDLTGFSKSRFLEMPNFGFDGWEWLNEIEEPTVFAVRSNLGGGSVVLVLCVSRENVNALIFLNNIPMGLGLGPPQSTDHTSRGREQFSRWFRTLLN